MDSYGLDETKDPKPRLRLEGPQIPLAGLAEPKVGQKFKIEAYAVIDEVYSSGPGEDPNLRMKPYVCFLLSDIELEPEQPDALTLISRMYPSTQGPAPKVYPV